MEYIQKVLEEIIRNPDVIRATKYISSKEIIRGVRRTFKAYNKKTRKNQNIEIIFTIGRPNYLEREFIKLCQKAKEPFPIKNIQLKFYKPKINKLK